MKNGWKRKKLDEVADVFDGPHATPKTVDSDPIFLGISALQDGVINLGETRHVTEEDFKKWTRRVRPQADDVVFSYETRLGQAAIIPEGLECCLGRRMGLVRFNECAVVPRFFLYQYLSPPFRAFLDSKTIRGATVDRISIKDFPSFPIAVPPVAEQQRIVGILDEAFEGIATAKANAEKNLQNAGALFESHVQSVFTQRGEGWNVRKISEVAKHSLGKMLDKAKNKGKAQPYLRNINVRWFNFDLSDLLQMPFLPEESAKYTAIKGDVLICEGGYPGRAAIWAEDYPIYFQKALHRVRFHESMHNKWFVYYFYALDKSGELKQHFSGTGIQHFTGEVLARFELPLPPLPELRRAVAKFEELSTETQRLEFLYQQKLAALDALKKSLLHQAFTGEL
jgi:type I restriction enzyme S subunit